MSDAVDEARKGRGRPATGKGLPVLVRLQPDLLAAVDRLTDPRSRVGRPEVIRTILREWLVESGGLSGPGADGLRPGELATEDDG